MEQQPEEKVVVNVQQAQVAKTNGLCIASFVLALVGGFMSVLFFLAFPLFVSLPCTILGIIIGIIGIRGVKRRNEGGKILGILGIVLSAIGLLISIGGLAFWAFFANEVKNEIDKQMVIQSSTVNKEDAFYIKGYADGESVAKAELSEGKSLRSRIFVQAAAINNVNGTKAQKEVYSIGYADGYDSQKN